VFTARSWSLCGRTGGPFAFGPRQFNAHSRALTRLVRSRHSITECARGDRSLEKVRDYSFGLIGSARAQAACRMVDASKVSFTDGNANPNGSVDGFVSALSSEVTPHRSH
jgi:hypothetical protein